MARRLVAVNLPMLLLPDDVGNALIQIVTQLSDQVAAKSDAIIAAFAKMLKRFDDLLSPVSCKQRVVNPIIIHRQL